MTVSVIVNAQSSDDYIEEALQSLRAQVFLDWEAIVWDNSPTDKMRKLVEGVRDSRLKYFYSEPKVPLYLSRMNAIAQARGSFVAFLDADDLWMPNKLERQLEAFSSPSIALSCTDYLMTRPLRGTTLSLRGAKRIRTYSRTQASISDVVLDYRVGMSTLMIRADVIRYSLNFDPPPYSHIEDLDIVTRCLQRGALEPVNELLTVYRRHASNHSRKFETQREEWERWLADMAILGIEEERRVVISSRANDYLAFAEIVDLLLRNQRYQAIRLWRRMPLSCRKVKTALAILLPPAILRWLLP